MAGEWQVKVNGQDCGTYTATAEGGLLTFTAPAGNVTLTRTGGSIKVGEIGVYRGNIFD
jgi:hypothetical protein